MNGLWPEARYFYEWAELEKAMHEESSFRENHTLCIGLRLLFRKYNQNVSVRNESQIRFGMDHRSNLANHRCLMRFDFRKEICLTYMRARQNSMHIMETVYTQMYNYSECGFEKILLERFLFPVMCHVCVPIHI